jgi:glycosyltransferase involved in cell wall biosynthesis
MNILLLAPQPFYQERGTPIAVEMLLQSLSRLGHRVDLLTYHEGRDVAHPGLRLFRIPRLPGVRNVPPGPSLRKILCDAFMLRAALRLSRQNRYDVVHAVEEAAFLAAVIRRRRGVPYVYDMDSSLFRQVAERFPWLGFAARRLGRLETAAIRGALTVVAVCDELREEALRRGARQAFLLTDVSLLDVALPGTGAAPALPEGWPAEGVRFLYVGNFEPYQGIGLLLESFARLSAAGNHLVLVGGGPGRTAEVRRRAAKLGIGGRVFLAGPQPLAALGLLCRNAEVLVSPRIRGNNTPMKIFSYLGAERAIVATDLPTHRQVLNDDVALLAAPEPAAFAAALQRASDDPALRQRLAGNAGTLARERYSPAAFDRRVGEICNWIREQVAG